jgi:hypothetical protein
VGIDSSLRFPLETEGCLKTSLPCLGSIDAAYNFSIPATLGGTADDFLVIVGVNHTAAGKATYTNLNVYDAENGASVVNVSDLDMSGSVDRFLPFVPLRHQALVSQHADKLYAITFARQSPDADPQFVQLIPTDGILGSFIPAGGEYYFFERIYINPRGTYGPAYNEVLAPFVVTSSARQALINRGRSAR